MNKNMKIAASVVAAAVLSTGAMTFGQSADNAGQRVNNAANQPGQAIGQSTREVDRAAQGTAGKADNLTGTALDQVQDAARTAAGDTHGQAKDLLSRGSDSPEQFDKHFVTETSQDNINEIHIAQLAEQQSENPQIKQLAQKLIGDHQKAEQQLEKIGKAMQLQAPTEPDAVGQAIVAGLTKKKGPDFDRHFLYCQLGDHTKDVVMFHDCSQMVQNPQVKQYVMQTLPVLQRHLQMIQEMTGADQAITAGAHLRGTGQHLHEGIGSDTPRGSETPAGSGSLRGSGAGSGASQGTGTSGINK
ncbi:MAG TPA: DUF4142 domain-containing protein [Tepidisphaeraceae bacterium]|nr:DUF4142 domain-containing protein [Tepidisphaeraceae bacterium]